MSSLKVINGLLHAFRNGSKNHFFNYTKKDNLRKDLLLLLLLLLFRLASVLPDFRAKEQKRLLARFVYYIEKFA